MEKWVGEQGFKPYGGIKILIWNDPQNIFKNSFPYLTNEQEWKSASTERSRDVQVLKAEWRVRVRIDRFPSAVLRLDLHAPWEVLLLFRVFFLI